MKKNLKFFLITILTIVFIALILIVKTNDSLGIDSSIYNYLISFKNPLFTKIVTGITNLGGTFTIIILIILSIIIFRKKIYSILITVNIINVVLITQTLKMLIQRPRPSFPHLVEENGFSFPSGHAMASLGFYGFLIYLVWQTNINKKIKIGITIILSILILLIGLSRIYLGVHYFTDVVAGFVCSTIYLLIFTDYVKKYLNNA